jgi:hypothetical protein
MRHDRHDKRSTQERYFDALAATELHRDRFRHGKSGWSPEDYLGEGAWLYLAGGGVVFCGVLFALCAGAALLYNFVFR